MKFYVVQPYGRDRVRESTLIYEANTATEAFDEIDRLAEQMKRTGARSDSIELLVVDDRGEIVHRLTN